MKFVSPSKQNIFERFVANYPKINLKGKHASKTLKAGVHLKFIYDIFITEQLNSSAFPINKIQTTHILKVTLSSLESFNFLTMEYRVIPDNISILINLKEKI